MSDPTPPSSTAVVDLVTNDLLSAALAYAAKGWRVLPVHHLDGAICSCGQANCRSPAKHPLISDWPTQATTDAETIRRWWAIWPEANVGLALGQGLIDIECDPRHGGDESLPLLERRIEPLPDTVTWISGRGGEHRLFHVPIDAAIRNAASIGRDLLGLAGDASTGVDVRAAGGFAVAPPSRHANGNVYVFGGLHPDGIDVAELPLGWLDYLTAQAVPAINAMPIADGQPIPEGQRNDTLFKFGCLARRYGSTRDEIGSYLSAINRRCLPPLDAAEVAKIAAQASDYEPHQASVAMMEGWDKQVLLTPPPVAMDAAEALDLYPDLQPPLIHGLLRQGETMNVIAASKAKKSWLVLDLALSLATGQPWLGTFATEPGRVLLIDNELHPPTTMFRLRCVMQERGITRDAIAGKLRLEFLRGRLRDLHGILRELALQPPGTYQLIIIDAWYRTLPAGLDENDNGAVAGLYNAIDALAAQQGCAFALIHHSSKGNQAGKAVTDVGAGAGSQARAADAHLTLRPHREDQVAVLDGVVRSWPPLAPVCLRWQFPRWSPDASLSADDLDTGRSRRRSEPVEEPAKPMTADRLVATCLRAEPQSRAAIIEAAIAAGCSERRAERLLTVAVEQGLIHPWPGGQLAMSAPPADVVGSGSATARSAVHALLHAEPALSSSAIAERCGVTPQYVRKLRRETP